MMNNYFQQLIFESDDGIWDKHSKINDLQLIYLASEILLKQFFNFMELMLFIHVTMCYVGNQKCH